MAKSIPLKKLWDELIASHSNQEFRGPALNPVFEMIPGRPYKCVPCAECQTPLPIFTGSFELPVKCRDKCFQIVCVNEGCGYAGSYKVTEIVSVRWPE